MYGTISLGFKQRNLKISLHFLENPEEPRVDIFDCGRTVSFYIGGIWTEVAVSDLTAFNDELIEAMKGAKDLSEGREPTGDAAGRVFMCPTDNDRIVFFAAGLSMTVKIEDLDMLNLELDNLLQKASDLIAARKAKAA